MCASGAPAAPGPTQPPVALKPPPPLSASAQGRPRRRASALSLPSKTADALRRARAQPLPTHLFPCLPWSEWPATLPRPGRKKRARAVGGHSHRTGERQQQHSLARLRPLSRSAAGLSAGRAALPSQGSGGGSGCRGAGGSPWLSLLAAAGDSRAAGESEREASPLPQSSRKIYCRPLSSLPLSLSHHPVYFRRHAHTSTVAIAATSNALPTTIPAMAPPERPPAWGLPPPLPPPSAPAPGGPSGYRAATLPSSRGGRGSAGSGPAGRSGGGGGAGSAPPAAAAPGAKTPGWRGGGCAAVGAALSRGAAAAAGVTGTAASLSAGAARAGAAGSAAGAATERDRDEREEGGEG